MTCLQSVWRACKTLGFSVVCWTGLCATAVAQAPQAPQDSAGSWVIPYCLVAAAVGASLTLVLRPNRRLERARIVQ